MSRATGIIEKMEKISYKGKELKVELHGQEVWVKGTFSEEEAEEMLADSNLKKKLSTIAGFKVMPADRGSSGENSAIFTKEM